MAGTSAAVRGWGVSALLFLSSATPLPSSPPSSPPSRVQISEKSAEVGETIRRAKGGDGEDPTAVMTDPLLGLELAF